MTESMTMTLATQGFSSFDVLLTLFGLSIFLCNLVVLLTILTSPPLHSPTNIYLAGMAVADAAVGLVNIPVVILTLNISLSFTLCHLLICFTLFIGNTSNFMILGFTLDRLLLILSPFRISLKRAMIVVVGLSGLAFFGGIVFFANFDENLRKNYNQTLPHIQPVCTLTSAIPIGYLVYVQILMLYAPVVIILAAANFYTIFLIRRHSQQLATLQTEETGEAGPQYAKRILKVQKLLVKITSIFLVCTLPLVITMLINYKFPNIKMPYFVHQLLILLYFFNSLINPFIYAYNNQRLKSEIHNILNRVIRSMCRLCKRRKKATPSVESSSPGIVVRQNSNPSTPVTIMTLTRYLASFTKFRTTPRDQQESGD